MEELPIFRKKLPDFSQLQQTLFQQVNKITDGFFGNSPPQVFIGSKLKYPAVNVGILSPPDKVDDAWMYDAQKYWAENNFDIPTIINLRQSLINSRFQTRVDQARTQSTKFVDLAQELGVAKKPVDVEIELKKKVQVKLDTDKVTMPMGPRAPLKKARITENTTVDRHVDKVVSDTDLKANEAIQYLYKQQVDEHNLSKILSIGVLGLKKGRRLVPTRWSITAVQDMIGKQMINQLKQYETIEQHQVYFGGYLGNYFLVFLFPDVWSFELFELYLPGSSWNQSGELEAATDFEWYGGRKQYAFATAGGYYANRLSVVRKLCELKRQASVLVVRLETPSYWAALGVWVVVESMRKAMAGFQKEFPDRKEMLAFGTAYVKKMLGKDISFVFKRSKLLERVKTQSRLQEFF